jgi:hypothetical protein
LDISLSQVFFYHVFTGESWESWICISRCSCSLLWRCFVHGGGWVR